MKSQKSYFLLCMTTILLSCQFSCTPLFKEFIEKPISEEPALSKETITENEISQDMPLSGFGDFMVGVVRDIVYVDESRNNREVALTIWYPAKAEKEKFEVSIPNATPDSRRAPYPIILSSTKAGNIFAPYLVSHGFTYVGVNKIDTYLIGNNNLIDQPLDILFALDRVAKNPPVLLENLINSNIAGTIGYSFDGYNSLAMSGARIDPQAYLERCANIESIDLPPLEWWEDYICTPAKNWQEFNSHAGRAITESDDGLWQPMTDARIKAVMPMGADGYWIFNKRGLAEVNRPIFFISAEQEEYYDFEIANIYPNVGEEEKYLITFIGRNHMMIYDIHAINQMRHFAVAFFGYYLQGKEYYQEYFSQEFVNQYSDLAWGVYQAN